MKLTKKCWQDNFPFYLCNVSFVLWVIREKDRVRSLNIVCKERAYLGRDFIKREKDRVRNLNIICKERGYLRRDFIKCCSRAPHKKLSPFEIEEIYTGSARSSPRFAGQQRSPNLRLKSCSPESSVRFGRQFPPQRSLLVWHIGGFAQFQSDSGELQIRHVFVFHSSALLKHGWESDPGGRCNMAGGIGGGERLAGGETWGDETVAVRC